MIAHVIKKDIGIEKIMMMVMITNSLSFMLEYVVVVIVNLVRIKEHLNTIR